MSRKDHYFGNIYISEEIPHGKRLLCFKNATFCPRGTTPYYVLLSNSGQKGQNSEMSPPSKLFSLRPQCECLGLKCPDSATSEAEVDQQLSEAEKMKAQILSPLASEELKD